MSSITRPASLLACAAFGLASTCAQAQSSVQLYGVVDVGVASYNRFNFDDPVVFQRVKKVDSGMMSTSYIGFKGKEDLGGGLAAVFQLETFLRPDTGSSGRFDFNESFWARAASVGLSSATLGSINVGRTTPPMFVSTLLFNPFVDSFTWSPSILHIYNLSAGGQIRGDSGWNNSAQYNSPTWGGLSANIAVTAPEGYTSQTVGSGKMAGGNLLYFGGPFSATIAYQTAEQSNTGGEKQKMWMVGAAYDAKVVKLFAQLARINDKDISGSEDKFWSAGASVPIGTGYILAAYGHSKVDSPGSSAVHKTATLGYDYFLSKRTDVTFALMRDEETAGGITVFNSAGLVDAPVGKGTSYGVNIRHSF